MSGFTSMQRETLTMGAGTATAQVAVTGTVANCVPFITHRNTTQPPGDNDWDAYCTAAYFSGSNLVVENGDPTTRAIQVEASIVEFDGTDIVVQSGSVTIADLALSNTATVTTITGEAFLYYTWENANANAAQDSFCVRGRITSATQLTFDRDGDWGDIDIYWFVVEAKGGTPDFTVQSFDISLSAVQTSNTATITSVNTAKTWLMGNWKQDNTTNPDESSCNVVLTNGTTVTLSRQTATGTIDYHGFAITFAGGETVQRGTLTQATSTASEDVNITDLTDNSNAMIINAGNTSAKNAGSFAGIDSSDNPDSHAVAWTFVDSDTIRAQHSTSGADTGSISWEVIDWTDGAAPAARRIFVVS